MEVGLQERKKERKNVTSSLFKTSSSEYVRDRDNTTLLPIVRTKAEQKVEKKMKKPAKIELLLSGLKE